MLCPDDVDSILQRDHGWVAQATGSAHVPHVFNDIARVQLDDGVHRALLGPPAVLMQNYRALCFDKDQEALEILPVLVQDMPCRTRVIRRYSAARGSARRSGYTPPCVRAVPPRQ
jgi:hypothetical protein